MEKVVPAPVDLSKLPDCLRPVPLRDPASVRLERPISAEPNEPLICGEYGPRFVGYGEQPMTPARPWLPFALGGCVGLAALAIEKLTGTL